MQTEAQTVTAVLFYVFALMSAISAITLVLSRNIVRTAVCLLFTLIGVAGLYFLLAAEFLAAVQLVVYAGGTLILIIFGVMLTSKSPFSRFEPKLVEIVIALSGGSILLIALVAGILRTTFASNEIPSGYYPVDRLGQVLLGDFLVPFEIVSVLLLVVMIGAAYLAKGRRRESDEAGTIVSSEASRLAREWT
jgi:NADH-quinone oxidoreductase subunit J